MSVRPEDTAQTIMSTDVELSDLGSVGARAGERSERGGLPEGPVWPVTVVERLELA
ncbi:hypothetical protein H4W81_000391 [Nonomuraea africana]|uniref:Uncharacterized protein n=1 Tax=Nonomuraea africana TaxID=46171 RepID=A0ABR9K6H9_9ACTN|nr:hypothetical protein [Nonomuraea africana]